MSRLGLKPDIRSAIRTIDLNCNIKYRRIVNTATVQVIANIGKNGFDLNADVHAMPPKATIKWTFAPLECLNVLLVLRGFFG